MTETTRTSLSTRNPFTGETIRTYLLDSFDQVETKIDQAREIQARWQMIPLEQRIELLKKSLVYFQEHKKEIAEEISDQMGRPLSQA